MSSNPDTPHKKKELDIEAVLGLLGIFAAICAVTAMIIGFATTEYRWLVYCLFSIAAMQLIAGTGFLIHFFIRSLWQDPSS